MIKKMTIAALITVMQASAFAFVPDYCDRAINPEKCDLIKAGSVLVYGGAMSVGIGAGSGYHSRAEREGRMQNRTLIEQYGGADYNELHHHNDSPEKSMKGMDNLITSNTPEGSQVRITYYPTPEANKRLHLRNASTELKETEAKLLRQNQTIAELRRTGKDNLVRDQLEQKSLLEKKVAEMKRKIEKIKATPAMDLEALKQTRVMTADKEARNITEFVARQSRLNRGIYHLSRSVNAQERSSNKAKFMRRSKWGFVLGGVGTLTFGADLVTGVVSRSVSDATTFGHGQWEMEKYHGSDSSY